MNNMITRGIAAALGCIAMASCQEIKFGDEFLDKQPESSGATITEMFSARISAEEVLTKAYTGLPYGVVTPDNDKLGGMVLEYLSDLAQDHYNRAGDGPNTLYYNGAMSPSSVHGGAAYLYAGERDWTAIRYAWLYIENVNMVPDMTASDKRERIAEARMIIALCYFDMLRYMGGIPWLDHAVESNEDMTYPRLTFAESVNRIVDLLDQAISDLPWQHDAVNDGRMSQAGAMALKFKVLQWAASPMVNSDQKWHTAADEYTCYGNYSIQRWKDAQKAGREFFEAKNRFGGYDLVQPAEPTHAARRSAYRSAYYDRGNGEILISTRRGYGPDTHSTYFDNRYYGGPTLNYVDMFAWEDGEEFPEDFNWKKPSRQPFFQYDADSKAMIPTRDPRLYENVACPGDLYYNGTFAPVYVNAPGYRVPSTGFSIMKFVLQQDADRSGRPVQWPHTRLPEIMLGYAEAICQAEGAPTTEAYAMVNDVRARVGLSALPDKLTKDQFIEAVLKERAMELGFEEVRWFDLVRYQRSQDFTKQLYGLESRGNDMNNPTEFTFKKTELSRRYWADNWDPKWYLVPIPQNEINKKYGMTQNPGW